uniref:Uncharacterized protein n=1 Tax=Arundo donax TaxID=35708 RepID=A0A0A8ZI02_ARUDO
MMSSLTGMFFDDSSLDDDDDFEVAMLLLADVENKKRPKHGGSIPRHVVVHWNKQQGHDKFFEDYFADDPVYGPTTFRRHGTCNSQGIVMIQ